MVVAAAAEFRAAADVMEVALMVAVVMMIVVMIVAVAVGQ